MDAVHSPCEPVLVWGFANPMPMPPSSLLISAMHLQDDQLRQTDQKTTIKNKREREHKMKPEK